MTDNLTIIRDVDGGYLVPTYIWTEKTGTKAKVMRTLGCIFKRHDWYRQGMERHDLAKDLIEIINKKQVIAKKVALHK